MLKFKLLTTFVFAIGTVGIFADLKAADEGREVEFKITNQLSGSKASLRGLSVVSSKVAWASGTHGTVLRSIDSGERWQLVAIEAAKKLDFRDIQAFDLNRAVVLSAGSPAAAYFTGDGGKTWKRVYENKHEKIFFDAMVFWNDQRGLAFSDPIDGRIPLIQTFNSGQSWKLLGMDSLPKALPGEAGFAASGTCAATVFSGHVWIGLGGKHDSGVARVVRSADFGAKWRDAKTPIVSSETSGIFSLAFADSKNGVAVGGDFMQPDRNEHVAAFTVDGGMTWQEPKSPPSGFRACVGLLQNAGRAIYVAVGRNGSDYSTDGGRHWIAIKSNRFNAIQFASDGPVGWSVGPDGTVARWQLR